MKIDQAIALKNELFPEGGGNLKGYSLWEARAKYIFFVKLLYGHGFYICPRQETSNGLEK